MPHTEPREERARRQDERDVARWRAALEVEIARATERLAKGPSRTGFTESNLQSDRAILEVLSRGLDPSKRRTFRGRVLLEVRCEKRGHVLARVYPTSIGPLFIPSVSHLPIGKNRENEHRFGSEGYQREKEWRKLFQGTPMQHPASYRDEWILDFTDPDERGGVHLTIRGLEVLTTRHRREEMVVDGTPYTPAFEMMCRCGTVWAATSEVMSALDSGRRVLRPEVFRRAI